MVILIASYYLQTRVGALNLNGIEHYISRRTVISSSVTVTVLADGAYMIL